MHGCALLVFVGLAALLVLPGASIEGLPLGFFVGLVAGGLVGLAGIYNIGWNDHVELVRERSASRADHEAESDRR